MKMIYIPFFSPMDDRFWLIHLIGDIGKLSVLSYIPWQFKSYESIGHIKIRHKQFVAQLNQEL